MEQLVGQEAIRCYATVMAKVFLGEEHPLMGVFRICFQSTSKRFTFELMQPRSWNKKCQKLGDN